MAKGHKINTASSMSDGTLSEKEYQESLKKSLEVFKDMKKVKVSIPKQMASVLGSSLPVGINGCVIVIPVDGKQYEVPEAYAEILHQSLQVVQAEDVRHELEEKQKEERKALGYE